MEPTFYFQGKPDEWRIVPFSSLEFDNITLDENYTVLNDSFWTDSSRAIWSDAQNVAWHYANQLVLDVAFRHIHGYSYAAFPDLSDRMRRIVSEWGAVGSWVSCQPLDNGKYSVINGYHRLLAMHNCPFTIEQATALGFDLTRMHTDENGLLRLDSRTESPEQPIPVHIQSA